MSWLLVEARRRWSQRYRYSLSRHVVGHDGKAQASSLLLSSRSRCLLLNLFLILRHRQWLVHLADYVLCVPALAGLFPSIWLL